MDDIRAYMIKLFRKSMIVFIVHGFEVRLNLFMERGERHDVICMVWYGIYLPQLFEHLTSYTYNLIIKSCMRFAPADRTWTAAAELTQAGEK